MLAAAVLAVTARGGGCGLGADHGGEAQLEAPGEPLPAGLLGLAPGQAGRAQPRVDELVDAEVEQRQRGAEEGHRQPGRDVPPPVAADLGVGVLRLEQHRAPAPVLGVDQPQEGQRGVGAHPVEHGEQERGRHDGQQVGQDLVRDHPPAALADDAGRVHVVAGSQRQGLGAQHPGSPRPAGDRDDQADQHVVGGAGGRQEAEDHDEQRQRRHDQEEVGQHGQELVRPPAVQVPGADPDHHRQHGGRQPGQERDQDRAPAARQQLREHVLLGLGGAEPVRGGRRLRHAVGGGRSWPTGCTGPRWGR